MDTNTNIDEIIFGFDLESIALNYPVLSKQRSREGSYLLEFFGISSHEDHRSTGGHCHADPESPGVAPDYVSPQATGNQSHRSFVHNTNINQSTDCSPKNQPMRKQRNQKSGPA